MSLCAQTDDRLDNLRAWGLAMAEKAWGGRVTGFEPIEGGIARAIRGQVTLVDGRRLFVKMMDNEITPRCEELMQREAHVSRLLRSCPQTPVLQRHCRDVGRFALYFDWVDASDTPPKRNDIPAIVAHFARWSDFGSVTLQRFDELEPLLFSRQAYETAFDLIDSTGLGKRDWEGALEGLTSACSLLHADLRLDNVIWAADGGWVVDWAWGCLGHPIFDRLMFLNDVALRGVGGLNANAIDQVAFDGKPTKHAKVALAQLAGAYHIYARQPDIAAVPGLRKFQQRQAEGFLGWLERVQ